MYKVYRARSFERSITRLTHSGKFKTKVREDLSHVVQLLEQGHKLPENFKDHQLSGDLKGYRECHIQGDLLLLYQIKKRELVLLLLDIGSHSYLNM